jgi:(2Fe-2S) ferredoxin
MSSRCTVVVCRGCCCGLTRAKKPDGQAKRSLELMRRLLHRAATVQLSGCLGPCGSKDVVVVRPSREGRLRGARPQWFGFMRDEGAVRDLAAYVEAGGPGVADLPSGLAISLIDREGDRLRPSG